MKCHDVKLDCKSPCSINQLSRQLPIDYVLADYFINKVMVKVLD